MAYRYETHLHTSVTSACSCFTPREIVDKYVALQYAGVFVTDHFLNGNTTVPPDLCWEERIAKFCEGYEQVKACAEHTGLSVFFGLEYSYLGTDFLVYGLGKEWLFAHPEMMRLSAKEFCLFARKEGGLIVQAHPCREDWYIDHVRLFPSAVDAFETPNANRTDRENRLADVYANEYRLHKTAGSDIHAAQQKKLAGMQFATPVLSGKDYAKRVLNGEGEIFTLTE